MIEESESELLTVEEAANRLGIGKGLMYKLLNNKEDGIKALRISRQWKIPPASITEYINRKCGLPK